MSATYRDETEGLHLQIEALLERYREESKSLAKPLRLLYARRSARMLAGKVAIFGAALLALVAAFSMIRAGSIFLFSNSTGSIFNGGNGGLTLIFLTILAMVVSAYAAGLLLARGALTAKLDRPILLTGDAHRDLAQLEAASPLLKLRRLLVEQDQRSISLPLFGAMLLLPLTLHLAVYMFFWVLTLGNHSESANEHPLAAFDNWITWSVVFATHAHLIIAYMGSRLPRHLAEQYTAGEQRPPTDAGLAVFFGAFASLFPGGVLYLLPPLLVALTGAAVVLPAFYVARQRFVAERELLAA